jgi:hypothetical protein
MPGFRVERSLYTYVDNVAPHGFARSSKKQAAAAPTAAAAAPKAAESRSNLTTTAISARRIKKGQNESAM